MKDEIKAKIKDVKDKIEGLQRELRELQRENSGLFIGEKYYEFFDDYELQTVFLGYLQEEEAEKWKEITENSGEDNLINVSVFQVDKAEYELRLAIDKIEKANDALKDIRYPYYNVVKHHADSLTEIGNKWRKALNEKR